MAWENIALTDATYLAYTVVLIAYLVTLETHRNQLTHYGLERN